MITTHGSSIARNDASHIGSNTGNLKPWPRQPRGRGKEQRRGLGQSSVSHPPEAENALSAPNLQADLGVLFLSLGFPGDPVLKNPSANRRLGFDLWVGKIPWRREWQPTPIFFPGKPHGQRSLVGCSPWGYNLATEQQKQPGFNAYCPRLTSWALHPGRHFPGYGILPQSRILGLATITESGHSAEAGSSEEWGLCAGRN